MTIETMLNQIMIDSSELATWFICSLITVLCVLLYNILKRLERNQEKHSDMLTEHGKQLSAHEERLNTLDA